MTTRLPSHPDLDHLKIEIIRVQCLVYPEQTRKVACLKRTTFQEEGVLRAWWYDERADQWKDELVFSMLPEDINDTGGTLKDCWKGKK
jgi:RimJ/RimL family protein N-acetyltransferase